MHKMLVFLGMILTPLAIGFQSGRADPIAPAFCAEVAWLPGDPSPAAVNLCGSFNKIAFITAAAVAPNLGGLAEYDALCTTRARAAGLPGSYKAWLLDDNTSVRSRFTRVTVPYVRPDGVKVAANFAGITSGTLLAPINVTENKTPVSGGGFTVFAWTGTAPDGTSVAGQNLTAGYRIQTQMARRSESRERRLLGPIPSSLDALVSARIICTASSSSGSV